MPITNFDKVELLLPMTGENNGTAFTDYSLRQRVVTRFDAVTSTAQSKFSAYGSSGRFVGNLDRLSVAESLDLGSSDFFIGGYIRPDSISGFQNVIAKRLGFDYGPFSFALDSGKCRLRMSTDGSEWDIDVTANTTLSVDTWHHIAFTREGTSIKIYVDGVLDMTAQTLSGELMTNTSAIWIGSQSNAVSPFSGYMQDWVIFKDTPFYTANFTPPSRMVQREITRVNTGTDSHVYDRAVLFDWNAGGNSVSHAVTPDSSGDFVVDDLIDLEYGVALIKDGCAPICRGPISVDPD